MKTFKITSFYTFQDHCYRYAIVAEFYWQSLKTDRSLTSYITTADAYNPMRLTASRRHNRFDKIRLCTSFRSDLSTTDQITGRNQLILPSLARDCWRQTVWDRHAATVGRVVAACRRRERLDWGRADCTPARSAPQPPAAPRTGRAAPQWTCLRVTILEKHGAKLHTNWERQGFRQL